MDVLSASVQSSPLLAKSVNPVVRMQIKMYCPPDVGSGERRHANGSREVTICCRSENSPIAFVKGKGEVSFINQESVGAGRQGKLFGGFFHTDRRRVFRRGDNTVINQPVAAQFYPNAKIIKGNGHETKRCWYQRPAALGKTDRAVDARRLSRRQSRQIGAVMQHHSSSKTGSFHALATSRNSLR